MADISHLESNVSPGSSTPQQRRSFSRREFLACVASGATVAAGYLGFQRYHEHGLRSATFLGRAERYSGDLAQTIGDGLAELGFGAGEVRGKTVLLKPNLVEPSRQAAHVNTHPAVVRAAAHAFQKLGARTVVVAEGQGHIRDTDFALEQSGFANMLADEGLEFIDLNVDDVDPVPNRLGQTGLNQLWLPRSLLHRADIIVSMPKLKTHHHVGITVSMKNLFGVMPGACYGWPKNLLHQVGIPQAIVDITATVRPHLAIVDGIIGMEGDGPIMGEPKPTGVLIMGRNLPAVDATAARVMGIEPRLIPYLAWCSGRLGPLAENHIAQRGEPIRDFCTPFTHLERPAFQALVGSYTPSTVAQTPQRSSTNER